MLAWERHRPPAYERGCDLSVVLQGALSTGSVPEVADAIRRWRGLFPAAQIIFSISVAQSLTVECDPQGRVLSWRATNQDCDLQLRADELLRLCDRVVLSEGALPLPPIKLDESFPNNANLQIAAAKAGLRFAERRYTFRARVDLRVSSRHFLDFYFERYDVGQRVAAKLEQRVLISQLFTLDPFGRERLPLHFSDWFHFGLTCDVQWLWNVPRMPLQVATHYGTHAHASHSNDAERRFRTRFAVEQWIARAALTDHSDVRGLRYHNDLAFAERSVRALLDDCVVADLVACEITLPKQARLVGLAEMDELCVTPMRWLEAATCSERVTEDVWRRLT